MNQNTRSWRWLAGALALAAIGAIALYLSPQATLRAYLFAWMAMVSIALGSMSILMLQHLTGGAWGWIIRRPAEAAAMTLPLLALLFVPIAAGLGHLYPWADPIVVADHAILKHRQTFFSIAFVIIRAAVYFAIWIFLAWELRRLSLAHDESGDPGLLLRLRRISAVGFPIYFITMSLASADWIASLEIDWYSSTFGLLVIVGQAVSGTTFLILVLQALAARQRLPDAVEPAHVHDLGNLLLTMVVLWAYIAFSQFLVIWIGNTQDDMIWYIHRRTGVWGWIGLLLILLYFAVPFALLLFQPFKRRLPVLSAIAGGVFAMQIVHTLWMIAPSSLTDQPGAAHLMDLFALIFVGGIWLGVFGWLLVRHPLMPLGFRVTVEPLGNDPAGHEQPAA